MPRWRKMKMLPLLQPWKPSLGRIGQSRWSHDLTSARRFFSMIAGLALAKIWLASTTIPGMVSTQTIPKILSTLEKL